MSTALWVIFWILAVFVGSLICSLVIAALIRAGGADQSHDSVRDREPPARPDPAPGPRVHDEEDTDLT